MVGFDDNLALSCLLTYRLELPFAEYSAPVGALSCFALGLQAIGPVGAGAPTPTLVR